jgi:arylsulfatase A-like enzyme
VPFVVVGPTVSEPGSSTDALVHFVDIFPTLAEIADVDLSGMIRRNKAGEDVPLLPVLDGHSVLPNVMDPAAAGARDVVFTEGFKPSGGGPYTWRRRTTRDAEWKYTRVEDEEGLREGLYRIDPDAWDEGENLMHQDRGAAAEAALERLRGAMDEMDDHLEFAY